MNEFIFGMAASFIKKLVKDPIKKRKMRNICLEIFQTLKMAYAGDADFE